MGIIDSFTQEIGYKPDYKNRRDGSGRNIFSPDGSIYVDSDYKNGVRIFDFDRCTGMLNNFRWINQPFAFPRGVAISPNSRFLYVVPSSELLLQIDLWASDITTSIDTVGIWDGYCEPCPGGIVDFAECQLAMDGKIYIGTTALRHYLHYIDSPDVKGVGCNFVQRGVKLLYYLGSIPLHPNYRLGALPGSPCDTIRLSTAQPTQAPTILRAYPNPAQEWVMVEIPDHENLTGSLEYRVYSSLGNLAKSGRVPEHSEVAFIPVSDLPNGSYLCHILNNGQTVGTARISIIRNN